MVESRRAIPIFWVLFLLVASACGEEEPKQSESACTLPCISPVQGADAGPHVQVHDAATVPAPMDASAAPRATPDAGNLASADSGVVQRDGAVVVDAGGGSADSGAVADASAGSMLPPAMDYAKAGPFKTTMTANVGPNNGYTIFRPEPLGENGFIHTPIIFGPGILTSASTYRTILTHFATHGFVTICVNSMSGGPGDPNNLKAMTMGLDWLLMQNTQAGTFQGKLAVDRAIAMGYSIGATASVELSSHKAIMSTVVIHGHNTKGDPHGPVLMITGTNDVIDDMRKTLSTLTEAPAVLVALPIGHLDVLTEIGANGRYLPAITAWMRYWAHGDQGGKAYFWGDGCTMCKSPWITPEPNEKWKALML